jgi:protein involved in polysaccharide export with SLBB domain
MARNVEFRDAVRASLIATAVAICAGCVGPGPRIRTALKTPSTAPSSELATSYTLCCPDAVDVHLASSPSLSGRYRIAPDGTIELAGVGRVLVDGQTAEEAAIRLAKAVGSPPEDLRISVAEHNSRQILVFGPSGESERVHAYRGAETAIDFLRRIGGLSETANFAEIHVVRPHVAAGRRPEVFHVNLEEILINGDDSSNVVLQPYDHVYIGATRRSVYAQYLPGGDWAAKPAAR